MTDLQLLEKFKYESAKLNLFISRKFASLTIEQINFHISSGKWSVGECFEHMIAANRLYYDKLADKINKKQMKTRKSEELPVKNSFIGKKILQTVKPDSNRRMKTFKVFEPSKLKLTDDVFERFVYLQNKFLKLTEKLSDVNLSTSYVTSPVSKLIRLNFADVFMIIIYHNMRHIKQAEAIVDLCFFPKEPNKNEFNKK